MNSKSNKVLNKTAVIRNFRITARELFMNEQPSKKLTLQDEMTEFLLYTAPNEKVTVEVLLNQETLWLTQLRIADLFGVQRPAITKHLKNIFESGELDEKSTSSILEHMGEDNQLLSDFDKEIKKLEKRLKRSE